jgi:rhodanese-related sulfurtransferase
LTLRDGGAYTGLPMTKQHSPRFLETVDDARRRISETDAAAVGERIRSGEPFHLVDVREESEWEAGHLPGAVHIGKGVLERDIEKLIPNTGAPIVLYCGGGYRSALAADALQKMGYTNVKSMDGGFSAWRDAGNTVEVPNTAEAKTGG